MVINLSDNKLLDKMRLFGWDTWSGSFRGQSSGSEEDSGDKDFINDLEENIMNLTPERKELLTKVSPVYWSVIIK